MKFFLLLLTFLTTAWAALEPREECLSECPTDLTLRDADCTGFKVRNQDFWGDFAIYEPNAETGDMECVEAEDSTMDFNTNFLCCSENESDCCEDYPGGFYAGFAIGVGGIALMVMYAAYLCFGSSSDDKAPES